MPSIAPNPSPDAGPGCSSSNGAEEADPRIGLSVDVVREGGDWSSFVGADAAISSAANALAVQLRLRGANACVALSSDAHVAELNETYRNKPAPTNVLSFPAGDDCASGTQPRFLGDVILANETLAREAQELGLPPLHHLQHLVVHGLLHLLGYDHEQDADADAMEALEVEILAALGVADPYARATEPTQKSPISHG